MYSQQARRSLTFSPKKQLTMYVLRVSQKKKQCMCYSTIQHFSKVLLYLSDFMHVLTNLVLVYITKTDCKIKLYGHQPSGSSSPTTQSRQTDVIASDSAAKEVHIVYVYIFKDKTEKKIVTALHTCIHLI
jgi:hypothetical protein